MELTKVWASLVQPNFWLQLSKFSGSPLRTAWFRRFFRGLHLVLIPVLLLTTGCGGNGSPRPDLNFAIESPTIAVVQGQSQDLTLTLSSKSGFRGRVSFALLLNGQVPSWLTVSPSDKELDIPPNRMVEETLRVVISKNAPSGTHRLRIVVTYANQPLSSVPLDLTVVSLTERLTALLADARDQTFAFASAIKALSPEESLDARVAVQGFVSNGEQFAEWLEQLSKVSHSLQTTSRLFPLQSVDPILVYDTGNIVKDAKEKAKRCEAIEDPIESQECFNKLRRDKFQEVGRFGVASLMGGGASVIAGGALAAASAPILITVAGGVAAGLAVSWFVSWCTSPPSGQTFLPQSGQACYMVGGKGKSGESLPVPFAGEGKLILHIDGLTPVVLDVKLLQGKEVRIGGNPPRVEYLDAPKGPLGGDKLYMQLRFKGTMRSSTGQERTEELAIELPWFFLPEIDLRVIPGVWKETGSGFSFIGGTSFAQYRAEASAFARMEIVNSTILWRLDIEVMCQEFTSIGSTRIYRKSIVRLEGVPFRNQERSQITFGAAAGRYVKEIQLCERDECLVRFEFLDGVRPRSHELHVEFTN